MKCVFIALPLTLAFGLLACCGCISRSTVVGVWKGTDEFGHEHYFEFHKDGTLTYWDRLRSEGSYKEGPHFRGSYKYENGKTITLKKKGMFPEPLGRLTLTSETELKQDGGEAMRHNLVYRRVAHE